MPFESPLLITYSFQAMPFISLLFNKKMPAAFLVLTLLVTDLPSGVSAHAALPAEPQAQAPVDLNRLALPAELGSVESVTEFEASPFSVVILQDAHAVPAAQKALFQLTRWFQREKKAGMIFLEGASGHLDPLLLKNFPDSQMLEEVLMSYLEAGEISGAAAASVMESSSASFKGIENAPLYRASINAYLEASRRNRDLEVPLKKIREELLKATGPEDGVLAQSVKLLEGRMPFGEQLVFLNSLVTEDFRTRLAGRFPDVFMLLNSVKTESALRGDFRTEAIALAESYEQSGRLEAARVKEASLWKQQFLTEALSAEDYAGKILKASVQAGRPLQVSKPLSAAIELKSRFDALNATGFSRQWKDFQESVLGSALAGQSELFQAWKGWLLLDRWQRLELSPEDWAQLDPQNADSAGFRLAGKWGEKLSRVKTVAGNDNPWDRFYRLAAERDDVFASAFRELSGSKEMPRLVLLAAGGFHTEGVEKKLSEMGISHARVLPAVLEIPEESLYQAFMSGQTSWKRYFKKQGGSVDVYEAFQQSAADRFAERLKGDPAHFSSLMTLWRAQVLRALARENRLSEAPEYTVFIDRARFACLPEKERRKFEQSWERQLSRFLEQMRSLHAQNRLSGESLAALPSRSGTVQWPAVMGFVKGSKAPAAWAEGASENAAVPVSAEETRAGRSELRSNEESEAFPEKDRRIEILYDNPLKTPWKIFWRSTLPVFLLSLAGLYYQTVPQPPFYQALVTAALITGLYVLGAGSLLINYERRLLKEQMREKMVRAPQYYSLPMRDGFQQTVIVVPELFRAEPGERFPVEKFVNTALHALELMPSQIVSIHLGAQVVYQRGYEVPQMDEIFDSARNFDYGRRPDYEGPISLRLTIVHGHAERSELRAPPLTREESLSRFEALRQPLSSSDFSEVEVKAELQKLNTAMRDALNGVLFREGYQLVWNTLDYSLVRVSDQSVVGNISLGFILLDDGRLAADIGYDLLTAGQGRGLISDFHAFLSSAFPENLPLSSFIDNVPTLLDLLDETERQGNGLLTAGELSEVRALRAAYSDEFRDDFFKGPSLLWRSNVRHVLTEIYKAYPELLPGPNVMRQTQLGHLNRYYGQSDTRLVLSAGGLRFETFPGEAVEQMVDPAELSVSAGLRDFESRMNRLLDTLPFDPAAPMNAPGSYGDFAKQFAKVSGLLLSEDSYVPRRMFYAMQWGNTVVNAKAFFKDLFAGNFRRLPGHVFLGLVSFFNLLTVAASVPAIVLDDEKDKLRQLIFVNKIHFYLPGVALFTPVYLTVRSALSDPVTAGSVLYNLLLGALSYLVVSAAAAVLNFFSRGFNGHEMTHVFQFGLMERIRTELDLPVGFMTVYRNYFTHADLEAPPMPSITNQPPTTEQLKQQVQLIVRGFLKRAAELETQRRAALETREKWESEKRVNGPNNYHRHQVLLNDVIKGTQKGILTRVIFVDAEGGRTFVDASETSELPAVFNRRLREMRVSGGYAYRWSLAHERLTVWARPAGRSELRAENDDTGRTARLEVLARLAAEELDDLEDSEIRARVSALNAAAAEDEDILDGLTIYEAFVPRAIKEGPMVTDLSDRQMSDGPRAERDLIHLIDRIGFVLSGSDPLDLHRALFNVVVYGFIHPNEKVRYAAIRAASQFPDEERAETLPALREIARKDSGSALILTGLIRIFEQEGDLAALTSILQQPGDLQVARSAVRAIGGLAANQEALDRLIELVFNERADPRIVATALNTLANQASFDVASMILAAFMSGDYGILTEQAEKAFASDLAFRIDQERGLLPENERRSELRSLDESLELEEVFDGRPEKVRYNNGVYQAFFNRAVSLLKRARRDQHTPGASLELLEEAESKIRSAFKLMTRIRGRSVLPVYLERRAILERNLSNLLASNYVRRSLVLRSRNEPEAARAFLDRAFDELDQIEAAGRADRITRWTRSQALRHVASLDAEAARIQLSLGLHEAALEGYEQARRAYTQSLALLEEGDAEDLERTRSERTMLRQEMAFVTAKQNEARASIRRLIQNGRVEFRLMGSNFAEEDPAFLAGMTAPYPVLGRGEKAELFSEWRFFERYAEADGAIRWDEDNDLLIAYLGGQPSAAWAFQAILNNLTLQDNGLYVSPALRGSGLATILTRRLFLMLKNQGFKTFQIGPSFAHPSWGIERTPEAQAFHRSLISRLGQGAVSKIVRYTDGQLQGITVDLRRVRFSPRSELRALEDASSLGGPWALFWSDPLHRTSFLEGTLNRSYYQQDLIPVFDSIVAPLAEGSSILDVASGNGAAALALNQAAREAGKQIQIISIDQTDVLPAPEAKGQVVYTKSKAEYLAFPDESIDAAVSFFGLEFTDRSRSLAELHRVLKPGSGAVFILHAAESSLISFYQEYTALYAELGGALRSAARLYAEFPTDENSLQWFNTMTASLKILNERAPKPKAMRTMMAQMSEMERLLSPDSGASEDPAVRLAAYQEWERRSLNLYSVMDESVRAALGFEAARQLVRDVEKLGFEDVYVQPFMFQSQHLGWIFHATKTEPAAQAKAAEAGREDERDRVPPGYVMHEIGNLLAGLLLSDILLDPKETGTLDSYYGPEFNASYREIKKRYGIVRDSVKVIKKIRVEGFMRDMRDLFSPERVAPVVQRILDSGHPSAQAAARNFKNSSAWLHQMLEFFLTGGNESRKNLRPYTLISDAITGFGDSVVYSGSAPNMMLRVDTYAVELYRAIRNLTINAVHATDEQVTGRPRRVELNVEPVDPDLHDGFPVRIQVRDNGTGIAPDILPHIFDPYFTTKGDKGTGVGLDMVRKSVETVLGGKLTVETTVGEGTVFSIYLPASAPDRAPETGAPETSSRSELRDDSLDVLTRRQLFPVLAGAWAGLAGFYTLPNTASAQQPKGKAAVRKRTLPANAYLKNPLFREVYRDTQSGLFQMRTPAGLPYNQAV